MKQTTRVISLGLAVLVFVSLSHSIACGDTIYVSDAGGGKIMKYDSSGNGSVFASGLSSPDGLALDGSGNLYAACPNNSYPGAVYSFDSSGNATLFASSGLYGPRFLAFDSSGNLYVSSYQDPYSIPATIMKFDPSGNGSLFYQAAQNDYVTGLAFDSTDTLYAARYSPGSIMTFNPSSVFALGLHNPRALAFDSNGNLYVSVLNFNVGDPQILRFDPSGNMSVFASGLRAPLGIAFDSSDNLYVADTRYFGDAADDGAIVKIDPSGNRSVFASGFLGLASVVVQIPEPATWLLVAFGVIPLLGSHRLRRSLS
jgi:sugar lactone lactonase YvrE